MTVLIIHTQSRLRVLGASKRQTFLSPGLFVLRPFCPTAFLSTSLLSVYPKFLWSHNYQWSVNGWTYALSSCSQTLHALRVFRAHGMPASALHEVFRAVVIAKLCYASSAWWDFSTAQSPPRPTAFIRRSIRQGYCTTDHADITSFIDRPTADDTLFRQIITNPNHVLAHLLPEKVNTHYQLRHRQHDRQLIPKLPNCTAATLSSECSTNVHIDCSYWYWLLSFFTIFYCTSCVLTAWY